MITVITPFKGKFSDLRNFCLIHENLINSKKIIFSIIDSSEKKSLVTNHLIKYFYKPNLNLYEALNFGIEKSQTNYYLPLGTDDTLNEKVLGINIQNLNIYDILSFPTKNCEKLLNKSFLRINHRNFIYQHSASCIIKKSIHKKIGYYPTKLKIASDAYIILSAVKYGCKFKCFKDPNIGNYGLTGISSRKKTLSLWEMFLVTFKLRFFKSSIYYLIAYLIKKIFF